MLHKCANPACTNQFRRLREGKLFQIETKYFPDSRQVVPGSTRKTRPGRHVEHYWLCDECAPYMTLIFDRNRGMVTLPIPGGSGRKVVTMVPEKHEKDHVSVGSEALPVVFNGS
jgi:hypothetical protein